MKDIPPDLLRAIGDEFALTRTEEEVAIIYEGDPGWGQEIIRRREELKVGHTAHAEPTIERSNRRAGFIGKILELGKSR
jgi:hypothetical protein